MLYFSDPSGIFSHPERFLEDHLLSVAYRTFKVIGDSLTTESPYTEKEKEVIEGVSYFMGLLHDYGKATSYFQDYLLGRDAKNKEKTHHSLLSAIVSFNVSSQYLQDAAKNIESDFKNFLKILSYVLVKEHHSDLDDFLDELSFELDKEELNDLVDSIDEKKLEILIGNLQVNSIDKFKKYISIDLLSKQSLKLYIDNFEKERISLKSSLRKLTRNFTSRKEVEYYILTNLLYSALIGSDKEDAVLREEFSPKKISIAESCIEQYKIGLPKSNLDSFRELAYRESKESFLNLLQNGNIPRIFYLDLATGLGKTLIGFNLALMLKKHLEENLGKSFRLIYSLPFINIIEQNGQVFESIIKNCYEGKFINEKIPSEILLLHHHLSEISYRTEETSYDTNKSEILIENWQSNIIITTFVQLFHTLISNRNSMLMKFSKLANSIFIIDEVQALPLKYWKILDSLLNSILKELNSYAFIMTATKPAVFSSGVNILSKPIKPPDRYKIDAKSYINFENMENFLEKFEIESDKSYMFVLNTISEARKFYGLVKEKVPSEEITFLSSHVIPLERLRRIGEVKKGNKRVLVSTQIIEAGVDLDFDVVVRDFAPLDCIIQSAGRCNRSYNRSLGKVYVVKFKDEDKYFYSYIYDRILVNVTEEIIFNKVLKEGELYGLFDDYQEKIAKRKDLESLSNVVSEAIKNLKYDGENGVSMFSIIEKSYPVIDVFIELDENAKEIWKNYASILEIKDRFEKVREFLKIKRDFYSYVISVSQNLKNIPPFVNRFYYVSNSSLEEYYDLETGFIVEGLNSIW